MNNKLLYLLRMTCIFTLMFFTVGCKNDVVKVKPQADMEWWREARFGMFVHWGLYSVAAGEWNGRQIDGIGEWIQNFGKISNKDYEKLAKDFTMSSYNPENWVKMAKDAGAKYIVFTTKHHEGFCLYPSDYSDFDVEMIPYKGDPLKELVDACRKYGIKVGLYYSHRQDWREEAAAVMKNEYDGHYGKPKSEVKPDLDRYIQEKAIPQMKELLTKYGKIDVLWYDTPFDLTKEQSQMFVDIVRELQPECIINGRVGYDLGDYGALGDNEMPFASAAKDLEMVATMNHTWGYKKQDNNWKSSRDILCSLIECASRGVNYMINIGPKADGTVPQPSVDIMNYIGKWMSKNSESIYGTSSNPFNDNFPWGYVTRKDNSIYLHLLREPLNREIILKGMLSVVDDAYVLSDGKKVTVDNGDFCRLSLPEGLDYSEIPVIKVVCEWPARFNDECYINENVISIPVASGKIIPGENGALKIAEGCNTSNFNNNTGSLKLGFVIEQPGDYIVRVHTNRHWRRSFAKGMRITLKIDDNKPFENVELQQDYEYDNVRRNSYPESYSDLGTVRFDKCGMKTMTLSVDAVGTFNMLGFFGEDIQNESDNNIRFNKIELIKK